MTTSARTPFHPWAWVAWLAAMLAGSLLTQNPLYQGVLLLVALVVREAVGRGSDGWRVPLRWLWLIPLFTMIANALTIHLGQTVVARLPDSLPVVGGVITAEALAFGFASGFALVTLLVIFATFDAASDYYAMLRLVPGFLFQAALVASIALAFVPQTFRALDEIREAQQIRGHRFRGWRDLPPLFLPLLTMGLERSIQLAEAMESRGFGGVERGRGLAGRQTLANRLLMLASILLVIAGVALRVLGLSGYGGWLVILLGFALAAIAFRRLGRKVQRSRYRARPWLPRDRALLAGSIVVIVILTGIARLAPEWLLFYPYPELVPPRFVPLVGVSLLALALPVLLVPRRDTVAGAER